MNGKDGTPQQIKVLPDKWSDNLPMVYHPATRVFEADSDDVTILSKNGGTLNIELTAEFESFPYSVFLNAPFKTVKTTIAWADACLDPFTFAASDTQANGVINAYDGNK
jgi:hypothetical protein